MALWKSKLELEWMQKNWSENEARMRMLKRAMQQEQLGKESIAEILTRVTRKQKGLTKGEDEWDAAVRWTASKEAKRRILSQVGGSPQQQEGYGAWSTPSWPQQSWPQQGWLQATGGQQQEPHGGSRGAEGGKGGKGGKGEAASLKTPLDTPQRSRCPHLKGPFAQESERYECNITCNRCERANLKAYHAASWECDVQANSNRSKFLRGEVDRWGKPLRLARPLPPPQ